ncbi:MAG: hypothetical protein IPH98_18020 [Saprospiraceae bacterium]|nr:hypothetical protein [Candidatus Defluviibacterium haderslevense]
MRIFIEICFDGTAYCGWQKQPNASSVQQTSEERWSELFNIPVTLLGCGRTDTGVHASQFYVHHVIERRLLRPADRCQIKCSATCRYCSQTTIQSFGSLSCAF